MKTTFLSLVTVLVTIATASAQDTQLRQYEAAQKLKPARVTSSERIAPASEPGTPFTVKGVVVDPAGKPTAGVEILAYQTDRTGIYAAPGAADPWRLKGWAVTDAQGRFEFHTIRPGEYPTEQVPSHVHFFLATSCCGRQVAEVMFDDDPLVTPAFRARAQNIMFGKVTRGAGGAQEASYTFKLKPRGDF